MPSFSPKRMSLAFGSRSLRYLFKKEKLFGLVWTIFTFQTVLGRKRSEFHWLELIFKFFHVFFDRFAMLRRPLQLQTGENTGFITAKDLRHEALIKIHPETVRFQMRRASTHSMSKQNPAPSTPSLPKALSEPAEGICIGARKGARERRPLCSVKAPQSNLL